MPGAVFGDQNVNELFASISGDMGHEFSCKKVTRLSGNTFSTRPDPSASPNWGVLTNPVHTLATASSGNLMNGNVWLDRSNSVSPLNWSFVKSDAELVTLGTSFVKSTNPIQSQVDLLSSIAEAVVDGALLPELLGKSIVSSIIDPRKRGDIIRSLGGEYLNYVFAYRPLADDAAKIGVLIDTVNGLVDQWIKDSGTIVRRRRKVPGVWQADNNRTLSYDYSSCTGLAWRPSVPSSIAGGLDVQYPGWNDGTTPSSKMSLHGLAGCRVSSEITFSAGYEFDFRPLYLPSGGSAADLLHNAALRADLTEIAFGLDPGSIAKALYDATPFSWLLDWFVNIGDIIDNFRGLQSRGVQLLWGYITETVTRESYFEYALTWKPSGDVFFRTNGFFDQKSIRRIRATPFGFGTSFGSLSASQGAILAALAAAKS
jgi:hypothetical protein